MPITWRNVAAPNFGASNRMYQSGADQIQKSIAGLGQIAKDIDTEETERNTANLMAQIQGLGSLDAHKAAAGQFDPEVLKQKYGEQFDLGKIISAYGARPESIRAGDIQKARHASTMQAQAEQPLVQEFNNLLSSGRFEEAQKFLDTQNISGEDVLSNNLSKMLAGKAKTDQAAIDKQVGLDLSKMLSSNVTDSPQGKTTLGGTTDYTIREVNKAKSNLIDASNDMITLNDDGTLSISNELYKTNPALAEQYAQQIKELPTTQQINPFGSASPLQPKSKKAMTNKEKRDFILSSNASIPQQQRLLNLHGLNISTGRAGKGKKPKLSVTDKLGLKIDEENVERIYKEVTDQIKVDSSALSPIAEEESRSSLVHGYLGAARKANEAIGDDEALEFTEGINKRIKEGYVNTDGKRVPFTNQMVKTALNSVPPIIQDNFWSAYTEDVDFDEFDKVLKSLIPVANRNTENKAILDRARKKRNEGRMEIAKVRENLLRAKEAK